MKQFLRVVAIVALLVGVVTTMQPPRVHAADEGFNVITSPLPIKISTNPGTTVETELRLKNQSNQAEGIKVGLMKFAATGESGTPNIYDITAKDAYGSWVHFSPDKFLAQPNVWISVKMTIKVPADASLGYYLAVTFSPSNQPGGRDVTNLKGSAATLVLLDVKSPNAKRSLSLADFASQHRVYEYLPASFDVKVHNGGNIYIAPAGNVFIEKGGKPVTTLDFNIAGGSVLPQSNRVFNVPWNEGFPRYVDRIENGKPVVDEKGKTKQNLKWDFTQANKFRFGKYTAKLLIAYDDGKKDVPLESTVSFWVIPWKLMLLVLLIILVIGFGVFTLIRSAVRRARDGAGKYKRRGKK